MDPEENHPEDSPLVTFVVIARNEERNIASCLQSIGEAGRRLPSCETVMVDSRSSDATVEVASRFPISVARLDARHTPTPAAGRAIGTFLARGRYIFYVDGDMILNDRWLPPVIEFMGSNPSFGAVFGRLTDSAGDIGMTEGHIARPSMPEPTESQLIVNPADRIAGAVVIRRSVVEEVGGFNPFLPADEEAELSFRIISAGFRIGTSDTVMAFHPRRGVSTAHEILRRYRYGYFRGQGLVLRTAFRQGRKAFFHHLWRLKLFVLHSIWILLGITSVVLSTLTSSLAPITIWGVVTLAMLGIQALRWGPRDAIRRILSSTLIGLSLLSALFIRLPEARDFPMTCERLK